MNDCIHTSTKLLHERLDVAYIMTGVFRLSAVIVDAVAIACGYALAILLFGGVV